MRTLITIVENFNKLVESRSGLVSIGYPEIIARLFTKKFGKHAVLFARWYKDYRNYLNKDNASWFKFVHKENSRDKILELIDLYKNSDNKEEYNLTRKKLGFYVNADDWFDSELIKDGIVKHLEQDFFEHHFFKNILLKAIMTGKLANLSSYNKLSYDKALEKYENFLVFESTKPLRVYDSGYKWIDVGPSCTIVGSQMRNCGSIGVMGSDKDRTLICLFDQNNKPHVMVTYQPNEKEIKSEEGIASSIVKPKYVKYIMDLAEFLKVNVRDPKSKYLKLMWTFRNTPATIKIIKEDIYSDIFKLMLGNDIYYTDSYKAVSRDDLLLFTKNIKTIHQPEMIGLHSKTLSNIIDSILNFRNSWKVKEMGVNVIPIEELVQKSNVSQSEIS